MFHIASVCPCCVSSCTVTCLFQNTHSMAVAPIAVAKYVAVLSPDECAIHNWSDGTNILQRVFSLSAHSVVATRCFSTQKEALCWLTDPVQTSAVCASAAQTAPPPPTYTGCARWVAMVTPSSTASFQLNTHGLNMALTMLRDPLAGSCVMRRFMGASDATAWLATPAGGTLLEIIGWSTFGVGGGQGGPAGAATTVASGRSPTPHDPSVASLSLVSTTTMRSGCVLPTPRPASTGRSKPPSLEGASPPARGSRTAQRKRRADVLGGGRGAGASKRASSGSTQAVGYAAGISDDASQLEDVEAVVDLTNRAAEDKKRAEEDQVQRALASRRAAQRHKAFRTMPGEPPEHLNPPGTDPDTMGPTLSMANIRKFMIQHHAEWKATQVSGAPSNPSRRSPSMGSRPTRSSPPTTPAADDRRPRATPGDHARRLHADDGEHSSRPAVVGDDAAAPTPASQSAALSRAPKASPPGAIGHLAATGEWDAVCKKLLARNTGAFVSGGPGVGKSTFLKRLRVFLTEQFSATGEVVVIAPTGTSAKTADGCTYHSFFGFEREYKPQMADPEEEAARLLGTPRFRPIKQRLSVVRAVLLDEVSLVSAANLDVMFHLLLLSRPRDDPPPLWFAFGDFLQLRPVLGAWAFTGKTWSALFGDALLELTVVHRQKDPGYIQAVHDARLGLCSDAVLDLVKVCAVEEEQYKQLQSTVLHLMPINKDVFAHNRKCLDLLCDGTPATISKAVDVAIIDKDRDTAAAQPVLPRVSAPTIRAALMDCVAPPSIAHCLHARVMITTNRMSSLGVTHGSTGFISKYGLDGVPVVRLEKHPLPLGVERGAPGLHDAGDDWIEVMCGPVQFTARILAHPGVLAERSQLPFVLGWATTIHMSQSLTISAAVVDLHKAFEAGMVHTALGRVPTKGSLYIKSFSAGRLFADPVALRVYREWRRL